MAWELTECLRGLKHLKKIVFCGGSISDSIDERWCCFCDRELEYGWTLELARGLFAGAPQLDVVTVGAREWRKDRLDAGEQLVRDEHDEWKDKVWWT